VNSELALRPGFQPLARKATEARVTPRFAELKATVVQTRGASPLDRPSGFHSLFLPRDPPERVWRC
jgi:hypothetical protein